MPLSPVEIAVLDAATEDYTGLWEILWEVRRVLPGAREDEILQVAQATVRTMLSKGWLATYRRVGAAGSESPLPVDDVDTAIRDSASWQEPGPHSQQILVASTDEGDRAYFGRA